MPPASLTIAGTGIQVGVHLTPQARAYIRAADTVLYLVADPATAALIERLSPGARSLQRFYSVGKPRQPTYDAMVEAILAPLRDNRSVCAVFYGHPGVFAYPPHAAMRRARSEGFDARMVPAISAEDCLFADLGFDPGLTGCQSYEATNFLLTHRTIDLSAALILWQVGVVGNLDYAPEGDTTKLHVLIECLAASYGEGHRVFLYEASPYPFCGPIIQEAALVNVERADLSTRTTMFVPPLRRPMLDADMSHRLGLSMTHEAL